MLQVNLHVLHDWCCPLKCSKYTHNGKEPYYCMYNFLANNHCHDWTVLKPFRLCLKRKYTIILITHNTLTSKRSLRTLSIREITVLTPLWTDHPFALDDFCLESKVPGAGVVLESHENRLEQARTTHTCSEQSLRILMWHASYVQKQSSYTWQEKVEDQIREGSRRMYFKATAKCNISIWTKSLPPWHQVWFENCLKKRRAGSWLGRMPSSKINEIVKMILQAMSTTSMPRSAGTGEWSVHPSPIIP